MKLRLRHIAKQFRTLRGSVAAVRDISLDIGDGEFFVFLGPSGCGKSTLLNLVAGLEKPSAGKILFDEKAVADGQTNVFLPPRDRNVAMVFQSYALYPHLKVFDNIAFPLRVVKESRKAIQNAVETTARMLDIEASRRSFPAASANGWRSPGPLFVGPGCFCWMSRFPTWMPSCGPACGWN